MTVIAAGTSAPEFKLARGDGGTFTERDLNGQISVLTTVASRSAPWS